MHIKMYLPETLPTATLTVYHKTEDGWGEDEWHAATLEGVAEAAEMELGRMDKAYLQLAALGVPEITMTSYTKDGVDTNDPAEAERWHAFFRHPQNSGHSSVAKGRSAPEALEAAVEMESERQRRNLVSSAEYHEREAARLRHVLNGDNDE